MFADMRSHGWLENATLITLITLCIECGTGRLVVPISVKCGLDVSKDRFMTSYIFVELESSLETKKWSGVYGPLYEELPHVHLIIALDGDKLLKAVSVTWSHQRNAHPCYA